MGNELYQQRYEALGIPVPTGKKKGKLDVKLHWQKNKDDEDSVSSSY
jgi:hypothetical protein